MFRLRDQEDFGQHDFGRRRAGRFRGRSPASGRRQAAGNRPGAISGAADPHRAAPPQPFGRRGAPCAHRVCRRARWHASDIAADRGSTAPTWGGVRMGNGELLTVSPGRRAHTITDGPACFGSIWLPTEDLAAYGRALSGAPFAVPPGICRWLPPPAAGTHLRRLHRPPFAAPQPDRKRWRTLKRPTASSRNCCLRWLEAWRLRRFGKKLRPSGVIETSWRGSRIWLRLGRPNARLKYARCWACRTGCFGSAAAAIWE